MLGRLRYPTGGFRDGERRSGNDEFNTKNRFKKKILLRSDFFEKDFCEKMGYKSWKTIYRRFQAYNIAIL